MIHSEVQHERYKSCIYETDAHLEKAQYENRFRLMTSPWFALCKKEDLKKYLEKGGEKKANAIKDESLRDFVLLYIRTMTSPLAIGNDFRKYYEGKLKDGNFNVDEGKKAQLFEQLEELSETMKTRKAAENLYAGEVGMKASVFSAYATSCDRKSLGLLETISKTLNL